MLADVRDKVSPHVLSLFRIIVGASFALHGIAAIWGVLGGNMGMGGTAPAGAWPSWYAALIQVVAGSLVALGLGTRAAALLCSGAMAFGYFTQHQQHGLLPIQNYGEPAVMFSWTFLVIAIVGPGIWSLDTLIARLRRGSAQPETLLAEHSTELPVERPLGAVA
ncbi:DoxX family protein [Streptacidiphilus cavernicola]|uniref:DoxX family protein n=1 Tax=Streptacidiphilus cavernicola TaxID=3342716 RepID=A0ABV6VR21_9ACTN